MFAGCDIFSTRSPEKPSETGSSFVPPTTPSIVIDNLTNAVRDRNTEDYIRCFVDSNFSDQRFVFQPTQSAQTGSGALFRDWNLSSERAYFENFKSKVPTGSESALLLNGAVFQTVTADSAVYTAAYTLVVQHTVQTIPKQAQGTLLFVLALDRNNNWAIARWIDNTAGSDFSWSDFKARFSQ